MVLKRIKSLIPTLALAGVTMFSHDVKAGQRPTEGSNLVCTTIVQNGTFSIDYSNTFMGATLAPTDGLDIVTDMTRINKYENMDEGGHISVSREKSENLRGQDLEQSFVSSIEKTQISYHRPSGTAFLGFSKGVNSQTVAKIGGESGHNADLTRTHTDFQLRVRTDEQLRVAQDWLLESINLAGHGAAANALWSLFCETTQSPLLQNLIKEEGRPHSYHLTAKQLGQMKKQFDKTGTVSVPQNIGRTPVQTTR